MAMTPKLNFNIGSMVDPYRPLQSAVDSISSIMQKRQESADKNKLLAAEQANKDRNYLLNKTNADRTYNLGVQKQEFLEGAEGRELERLAQQAQSQAEANALLTGKVGDTVTNSIKKTESTFTPQVQADINAQYENLLKTDGANAAQKFKEKYGYDVDTPIFHQNIDKTNAPEFAKSFAKTGTSLGNTILSGMQSVGKGMKSLRDSLGYNQEKDVANDPIKYGPKEDLMTKYEKISGIEDARKDALLKQKSYDDSLEALNKQAILSSVGTKDKIEKVTKKILRDRTDDEKLSLLAEAASNIDTSTKEGKNKAIAFQKTYDTILSNKEAKDIYKTKQLLKEGTEEKRFQRDIDLALIKERINSDKKGKPSAKEISAAKGIVEYSKGFFNDDDSQEVLAAKALLDSQGISY